MTIVTYIPDQAVAYDANGVRESGAKLTFYLYDTVTLTPVYQDPDGTTASNPVLSLSDGTWPAIYWNNTIRTRVIKTSPNGSAAPATWEVEEIGPLKIDALLRDLSNVDATPEEGAAFLDEIEANAANVDFDAFGVGVADQTVQAKLRQIEVSPQDFGALGNGSADDTTPWVNALGTFKPIYGFGSYKIAQGLEIDAADQNGLVIRGSGSMADSSTGATRCKIVPTAAVTAAFTVDGTPHAAYQQGVLIENLNVDMTAMNDAGSRVAFNQLRAFSTTYRNVGIVGAGASKLGWKLNAGAFTTLLENCRGRVSIEGTSPSDLATTITIMNCGLSGLDIAQATSVTVLGGAVQPPWDNGTSPARVIYLAPGVTPEGYPLNTTGLYAWEMVIIRDAYNCTFDGAYFEPDGNSPPPSTYNDGTHGVLTLIPVVSVRATSSRIKFYGRNLAGCYLLDLGAFTYAPDVLNVNVPYGYSNQWKPNSVRRCTTNQTLTTGVWATVNFDTFAQFDTGAFRWDTTNKRLICLRKGAYTVNAKIGVADFATANTYVSVQVLTDYNGGITFPGTNVAAASGATMTATVSFTLNVNAGNYFEVQAYQNSGVDRTLFGGGTSQFSVMKGD